MASRRSAIHRAVCLLVAADLPRLHQPDVHDRVRAGPLGVDHADHAGRRADVAVVADLAAALRVERRDVQEHSDVLALLGHRELTALGVEHRDDLRVGSPVAGTRRTRSAEPRRTSDPDRYLLRGRTGARSLLLQELREPIDIDREPGLGRELLGQREREPERVGELERVVARQDLALLVPRHGLSKSWSPWRSVAANRSSSDVATCRTNASFSRSSG